jgi:Tfp pilus assembly protein PilF
MVLVNSLEAMLTRGQDSALLRYGLGGEYLKLKLFDKAIEHLRKALQHDMKYSAAWKLLGQALTEAGNTDAAIRAYEDGIRIARENGDKQTAKEMAVFLKRLQK